MHPALFTVPPGILVPGVTGPMEFRRHAWSCRLATVATVSCPSSANLPCLGPLAKDRGPFRAIGRRSRGADGSLDSTDSETVGSGSPSSGGGA